MVRWESAATDGASADLVGRAALLAQAGAVVSAAGATGPGVTGHPHVSAGLGEFAAYWAPFLGATSKGAEYLADHVTAAGAAFVALDGDLASAVDGPR